MNRRGEGSASCPSPSPRRGLSPPWVDSHIPAQHSCSLGREPGLLGSPERRPSGGPRVWEGAGRLTLGQSSPAYPARTEKEPMSKTSAPTSSVSGDRCVRGSPATLRLDRSEEKSWQSHLQYRPRRVGAWLGARSQAPRAPSCPVALFRPGPLLARKEPGPGGGGLQGAEVGPGARARVWGSPKVGGAQDPNPGLDPLEPRGDRPRGAQSLSRASRGAGLQVGPHQAGEAAAGGSLTSAVDAPAHSARFSSARGPWAAAGSAPRRPDSSRDPGWGGARGGQSQGRIPHPQQHCGLGTERDNDPAGGCCFKGIDTTAFG